MLTATPTHEPSISITAAHKIARCLRYLPLVDRWNPDFNLDPALVLAVGAAESGCNNLVSSPAGAMGIMQVIPRPWTARADRLAEPHVNIYWGMYILNGAINLADDDVRFGLAFYNCSYDKVMNDGCGSKGGLNYADDVLEFWLPLVQEAMEEANVE